MHWFYLMLCFGGKRRRFSSQIVSHDSVFYLKMFYSPTAVSVGRISVIFIDFLFTVFSASLNLENVNRTARIRACFRADFLSSVQQRDEFNVGEFNNHLTKSSFTLDSDSFTFCTRCWRFYFDIETPFLPAPH